MADEPQRNAWDGSRDTDATIFCAATSVKSASSADKPQDRRQCDAGVSANAVSINIETASVKLALGDPGDIDHAASKIAVLGGRYPEHRQKLVGR